MKSFSHVPPGFRFHPTDEELVDYYLRKKIASKKIDLDVIKEVDLYNLEPWDLQEVCRIGSEEESDWYLFSHKDKKYPTGSRTNRATKSGFWKATGRDKAIYANHNLIGMRKTLVFYRGRAPNGQKSDWIIHEYRLETNENGTSQPQEEGWVVCKVFKKKIPAVRKGEHEPVCWHDHQVLFIPDFDSTSSKQEIEIQYYNMHHDTFLQLPNLESPKVHHDSTGGSSSSMPSFAFQYMQESDHMINKLQQAVMVDDQVTDWRVLDKFVASQLSQDDY